MRSFILFVASAGYAGYSPVASGTAGTVVAVPIFWAFSRLEALPAPVYLGVFALAVALACWFAGRTEKLLDQHDSGVIVIDEVVGFLAATLYLEPSWAHSITAFFAFRLLDIVKPFPASYFDRSVSGGKGVVLDDVVSGLYANLLTRLLFWLFA